MPNPLNPLPDFDLMHEEWETWQHLWRELVRLGAITEADASASVARRDTEGQKLLALIRRWGDMRAQQGAERATSGKTAVEVSL